ncbi:cupin domain-containing protein [Legionella brunensis]|uniref:Cupin domain protein n=1 Tax=Legionella brunensis TaxID=29422 RepID=A0A0W0SUD8_9GAMM|nr:hypothetical protein [Legionella brunensis]KTC86829.1 hypothetical protein Lbru_0770 [Legionella brunensis]
MSINKIASALSELPEIWSERVHEYDLVLGIFDGSGYNLTFMNAGDRNVKHHHETYDAKLCFISGRGKVLIGDYFLEFNDGTTINVPKKTVHQIVCETDTLMLTIQNPATTFSDKGWKDIVFDEPLF